MTAPGRVVWLDGALLPPDGAALSIDDPAVRWGEGLFETMRAEGGRVGLLERHLDRLLASAQALGLAPMPDRPLLRRGVDEALRALAAPVARVRLTATARPTVLVEATREAPAAAQPRTASALGVLGAWCPGDRIAEHKTLSYAGPRLAQRRAEAAGADHALLLDAEGRLGQAALANVFCAVGGEVVTAPANGLLAGVARAVAMAALPVREEALAGPRWRAADEIVLTNAVAGAVAVVAVDGAPVGDGRPGPLARRLAVALSEAWG
jgi:branched-chain amino acid aminotransferase